MWTKEKAKQYKKKWRQKHLEYNKRYYQKHKEKIDQQHRRDYWIDIEKSRANGKLQAQKHREKRLAYCKKWFQTHKADKEYRKKRRLYYLKRGNNPRIRLDIGISNAVRKSLKGKKAGRSWEALVGYTLNDLIIHIEKQFDNKMFWDNYGSYWHIDHIKPKSLFDYIYPEDPQFKECWALSNLQPLEAIENLRKNNKYNIGKKQKSS